MKAMVRFVKSWLPPAITFYLRKLFIRRASIRFEGPINTWAEAANRSLGYGTQAVLDKVLAATLKVKSGDSAYERDSVLFSEVQYSWPVTAALMYAAACREGRLNVLDFGGSLGSSYFQNREFLEALADVRWSVVEQPHFVKAGREYVQDERLRFFNSIDESLEHGKPDIIVLSSVLHYVEHPSELFQSLLAVDAKVIVIDLTIVNTGSEDLLYIQLTPSSICSASYPVWSLSEKKLNEYLVNANYERIARFETLKFPSLAEIKADFSGLLYKKRSG